MEARLSSLRSLHEQLRAGKQISEEEVDRLKRRAGIGLREDVEDDMHWSWGEVFFGKKGARECPLYMLAMNSNSRTMIEPRTGESS